MAESVDTADKESHHSYSGRMQTLNNALDTARQKIISSAKLEMLQKNFRPIHKENPEALKWIHSQLIKQLDNAISEEVMLMFAEEQMEKKLNELDRIVNDQNHNKGGSKKWRPTGEPEADSVAYRIPVKQKEKVGLQHIITQLEAHNEILRDHVKLRRKKLIDTKRDVDNRVDKWRQINEAVKTIPSKELEDFMKMYGQKE